MGGKSKGSSESPRAPITAPPPPAAKLPTPYSSALPQSIYATGADSVDNNLAVGDQQAQTRASSALVAGNTVASDTGTEEDRRRLGHSAPVGIIPTSRGGGMANSAILTG